MGVSTYSPRLDRVKLQRTSSLAVPSATDTTISWSTAEYNPSGMWTSGANINIPRDGIYMVVINADWAATSAGTYRQTRMRGTTAGLMATEVVVSGITGDFRTIHQLSWIGELGPNGLDDQIYFTGIHSGGVSININGTGSTWVAVQMLRPL